MRRASKRDQTEPAIIKALESHGVAVTQLSQKGVPDLLCSMRGNGGEGIWFVVEVKDNKGKLTEDQFKFIEKHNAWVYVARSVEDVEIIIRSLK